MLDKTESITTADLMRPLAFVGGAWISADNSATMQVMDPATGEMVGEVPDLGMAETVRAIAAAEAALPAWRALAASQRAALLKRWHAMILAHQEALAQILTAEQGKPLAEARAEIAYGATFVEWFSEEAKRVYGDIIPAPKPKQRILVQKQPVGVCALIIPWNFPSALFHRKAAAALAAGCTIVLKPSELTPFSALALARLGQLAGLPDGVLNVVTGMPVEIGRALMQSRAVRKVSFTGSTRVGKLLLEQAAPTVKRVSLELGGNAPMIIFDDAEVKNAVAACLASKFRNAGQTCVSANRIYVQSGIYDAFTGALRKAVEALNVGRGTEPDVTIGPLINDAAVAKVELHVADAVSKGATVIIGGKRHALGGRFYTPTVLGNANSDMELAHDETFGPVAPLFRFETENEVIRLANATSYGLASYIFTCDLDRMFRVSEALETGIVGVNEGLISTEVAPFGGMKESGIGREGSYHGIDEYLETKYLMISPVHSA
ncbi:NAD-dependent succinate-semialdehyde dehydrogenase [Bradyrhizobium sp. 25ACV]